MIDIMVRRFLIKYLFLVLILVGTNVLSAQIEEPTIRTLNLGAIMQTKTVGIDVKLAYAKKKSYSTVLDFDLVSLKHPKEQKVTVSHPDFSQKAPFVFGKLNSFHNLRVGYGIKKNIGQRVSRNTINVSLLAIVGIDIGFLKPVYLEIYKPDSIQSYFELEKYDPSIHNENNIAGGAGYAYGIDEMEIRPGMYGKVGIEFGWGNYKTSYMVVEVGATLDAFLQEVPIMHIAENKSVFSGFYVSFAFAKIY